MQCTICKRFQINNRKDRVHGCLHCKKGCGDMVNTGVFLCQCEEGK